METKNSIIIENKKHVQRIGTGYFKYHIDIPGNAEPDMVSIKITNNSDRTLTDVRLNTDKQFGDFYSLETVLQSAGIAERKPTIDNLKKLLRFYMQSRSSGRTAIAKAVVSNPVLHFNVSNTGMCCYNNGMTALLAQYLGFRSCGDASVFWGGAHSVVACMIDGHLRLLDNHTPMMLCYRKGSLTELAYLEDCLLPDDRNPYLRIGDTQGIAPDSQKTKEIVEFIRKHNWEPVEIRPCEPLNTYCGTTMRIDLRPGESIEWPIKNVSNEGVTNTKTRNYSFETSGGGKWWRAQFCDDNPVYYDLYEEPQMYGNGKIVYEPDLSSDVYQDGVLSQFRIESHIGSGIGPNLQPVEVGKPADVVWAVEQPFVIVGGRLKAVFRRLTESDWLKVYVTTDIGSLKFCSWGELKWGEPIYEAPVGEHVEMDLDIDNIVCKPLGPMCQRYWIKIVMQAENEKTDVGIENIRFETQFMFDLHSRPHLERGVNTIIYKDATLGDFQRDVEVTLTYQPNTVPPVSPVHSRLEVPGVENAIPADGMRYFWVRVKVRDAKGRPICGKKVYLTSSRREVDDITWVPAPGRDSKKFQIAPLVLNHATMKFTNFRIQNQPALPAEIEHDIDDWNGYICFMVQSATPGAATLSAITDDGEKIGEATVHFTEWRSEERL